MKQHLRYRHALAAAILATIAPAALHADTLEATWDGSTGNWSDSLHWNLPSNYPDNNLSPGTYYDVFIPSGTVALDLSPTVDTLTLGTPGVSHVITLNSPGDLTITKAFTDASFDTLFLQTNLTLAPDAVSSLTNTLRTASGYSLTNQGTLTLANITVLGSATLNNTSTGVIYINQNSTDLTTFAGATVINNGLIEVDAGTLLLINFSRPSTGTLSVLAGATVEVDTDGYNNFSGTDNNTLTGAGAVTVDSDISFLLDGASPFTGSFLVNGFLSIEPRTNPSSPAVTLTAITGSGTVDFASDAKVSTTFVSSGDTDVGFCTVTLPSNSSFNNLFIGGGGSLILGSLGGPITTSAVARGNTKISGLLGGGALDAQNGGTFLTSSIDHDHLSIGGAWSLTPGGTLTLVGDSSLLNYGTLTLTKGLILYGFTSISNTGTLTVGSSGSTFLLRGGGASAPFTSSGLISVTTGTFEVDADTTLSGTTTLNIGSALHLFGSTTLTNSGALSGPGDVTFSPLAATGTVTLTGSYATTGNTTFAPTSTANTLAVALNNSLSTRNLTFTAATVTGTGNLTATGNLTLINTSITANSLSFGGSLTIASLSPTTVGTSTLNTELLIPAAHAATLDANLILSGAHTLTNAGTLTVPSQSSPALRTLSSPGSATFSNTGTLSIDGLFAISSLAFINSGRLVALHSGTLTLSPNSSSQIAGAISLDPNTRLQISSDLYLHSTITGTGAITVDANHSLTLPAETPFAGPYTVDGSLNFNSTAPTPPDLFLSAPITVSSTGSLTTNAPLHFAYTAATPPMHIDGSFSATSGAPVYFSNVTLAFNGPASFTGNVSLLNSTVSLAQALNFPRSVSLSNASLSCPTAALFSGLLLDEPTPDGATHDTLTGDIYIQAGQTATLKANTILDGNHTFTNGGNFTLQSPTGQSRSLSGDAAASAFTNDGTLTAQGNVSLSSLLFTNFAHVSVQSGVLTLSPLAGSSLSGSVAITSGATLLLAAPVANSAQISGAGNLTIAADTTFLAVPSLTGLTTVSNAHAIFSTASLTDLSLINAHLSGTLTATGNLLWDGSTVDASLTHLTGAVTFQQSGAAPLILDRANFFITSFSTAAAASDLTLHLNDFAALINSGAFSTGGHNVTLDSTTHNGFFENAGSLTITGGTTTLAATLNFINSGTIDIQSGTLRLIANQTSDTNGTIHTAVAGTLEFRNSYDLSQPFSSLALTGAGTLLVDLDSTLTLPADAAFAGSLNISGALNIVAPKNPNAPPLFTAQAPFVLNAGGSFTSTLPVQFSFASATSVTFNNDTTFSHDVTFSNASLGGTGVLTTNANLTFIHSTLVGIPLDIHGGITFATASPTDTSANTLFTSLNIPTGQSATLASTLAFMGARFLNNNGSFEFQGSPTYLRKITIATPGGTFNNNGSFTTDGRVQVDTITFNSTGTLTVNSGSFALAPKIGSSITGAILIKPNASLTLSGATVHPSTLHVAGTLALATSATLDASASLQNSGLITLDGGTLTLAATQDPLTTGTFDISSVATLELAASYNFASPTGPALTGDGTLIIDPGFTLTLPMDTAFTGSIEIDGSLMLAAPLNPANLDIFPVFTLLAAPIPEPTSLALLTAALPLLARRRRRP